MTGLMDAGPTPTGHLTPCVIVTLPTNGTSEGGHCGQTRGWSSRVLAQGVHGILLCHAERRRAPCGPFVEGGPLPPSRAQGVGDGLEVGQRGSGGQGFAARAWGLTVQEYVQRADVWPLNPGRGTDARFSRSRTCRALANVDESPCCARHRLRRMGSGAIWACPSDTRTAHDPPYPPEMIAARGRLVLKACKANGVAFLNGVNPDNVNNMIDEGVMVANATPEAAEIGKRYSGR